MAESSTAIAARLILFCCGSSCYSLLGILSQLSKEADGSYAYSLPTVVMCAEVNKLLISFGFLLKEQRSIRGVATVLFDGPLWKWLMFAVPSVLYSCNNNLDMLNNLYMDPATEQVLVQSKIITTGIVWWLVFRQPLGLRKWVALCVLFMGTVLAGNPTSGSEANTESKAMFIEPFGVVLVTAYVFISAVAGVYNEWLFKGPGKNESLHASNIRLYTIGILFNISMFASMSAETSVPNGWSGPFRGYNVYTWALVLTYTFMGLIVSQVMRWFDNIVKLFMSGSSMYLSAFAAWSIFGYVPTARFGVGLSLTTAAMLIFNWDKMPGAKVPDKMS